MIEPKNIAVIEDEEKVWIKFALPGYMESCQLYRKMGRYTDVKIHCLHTDSEDVTIYSAHNMLLSSASTYFNFVLVKAFTQLTELRTNNLKKVLHIIENDHAFVDRSISGEENVVKFNVPLYCNDQSCCSHKHGPGAAIDSVSSPGMNTNCCKGQADEKETFSVILKSYNSANNIIMVVKGIDPVYFSYVLKCAYSESFSIEKKHIQMFLSFIVQIKLTNFATLTTLLEPFILNSSNQREEISPPIASSHVNTHKNLKSNSAFKLVENSEDYLVLNSSYDVHQWKDTNESQLTLSTPAPLDLSCKSLASLQQLPDRMHCSMHDSEASKFRSFDNIKHSSEHKYLSPQQWYFNYEQSYPIPNQKITNFSGFPAASSHDSRPDICCQKVSGNDSLWQGYANFNLQNYSHNYLPYISSLVSTSLNSFHNLKTTNTESNFSLSNEFKSHNLAQVGGNNNNNNNNTHDSNSHLSRESPKVLQKLEKNSSIEIKRLDVPLNFESGLKNKQRSKRKILSDKKANVIGITKVRFDCDDHFTRSCAPANIPTDHNSTALELPSKIKKSQLNNNTSVKPEMSKNLPSSDSKSVYSTNTLSTEFDKFNCILCEYSSEVVEDVTFHMKSSHFNGNKRMSKCIDLKCPVQLLFTSKEWETHIQHHLIKYFYRCSNCTYSTKTKKGILRHEMTHKGSCKRVSKVKTERNYDKNNNIQRKCKLSRSCSINTAMKVDYEQLAGSNASTSEIQSCNIFGTSIFKKLQKGLKKRRKDSAVLHRIHLQMAKVTKGKGNLKGKKSRIKTEKMLVSEVLESNEENASLGSILSVGKEENENIGLNFVENVTVSNTTKVHSILKKTGKEHSPVENDAKLHSDITKPIPSSSVGFPKIKTKTVRFLNKNKLKVLPCSLCDVVLSHEEDMISHYYSSHNMILPFKCPFRDCNTYLDNTSLLYSHVSTHAGGDMINLQIDTPSSSKVDGNDMTAGIASDLDL